MTPAIFVFFMLVFTVVGVVFLFFHLLMGSVIRPSIPDAEKLTIYECGEPTVGSAWVQFDLRYYVVALLFVIFDVEVAFFFPWATVFGKANQLSQIAELSEKDKQLLEKKEADVTSDEKSRRAELEKIEAKRRHLSDQLLPTGVSRDAKARMDLVRYETQTVPKKNSKGEVIKDADGKVVTEQVSIEKATPIKPAAAGSWAFIAFWDIAVFFGVLLVGFAYVWRRGDIDWVRAYGHHQEPAIQPERPLEQHVPPPVPAAPPSPVAAHH